ncbi:hypothetical protein OK016_11355 [Vibrio chagasii]|nr:hypothetical protein [Vibrio chagasii]
MPVAFSFTTMFFLVVKVYVSVEGWSCIYLINFLTSPEYIALSPLEAAPKRSGSAWAGWTRVPWFSYQQNRSGIESGGIPFFFHRFVISAGLSARAANAMRLKTRLLKDKALQAGRCPAMPLDEGVDLVILN